MGNSSLPWIFAVILIVVGAWWFIKVGAAPEGTSYVPTDTTPQTDTHTSPSGDAGINNGAGQTNTGLVSVPPVVNVASDATLGTYLVANNGMTLYRYTKDANGVSNCSGSCATNWPPYTVSRSEPLLAGDGILGQIATIARTDGATQVTYNGAPLYFWKNDVKAGDTTGQNVGGVWFVQKP